MGMSGLLARQSSLQLANLQVLQETLSQKMRWRETEEAPVVSTGAHRHTDLSLAF